MNNFWPSLPKPFFVLAPMDQVTDVVFRQIIAQICPPDVFFTEFTNVDGLNSAGREDALSRLKYTQEQRPIVAQIWGTNPDNFRKSAQLLKELGFDGIDINMGCPDRTIVKRGSCAALIDNPSLAKEIILATKEGAAGLPVSVKTRIGFRSKKTDEWIPHLLNQGLVALSVHGRTASQMSKVPANWDEVAKAVKIRDELGVKTLIVGNGDVTNKDDGLEKATQYGVDGIMIGRGIFQDLWAFAKKEDKTEVSHEQMLGLLLEHARLFDRTWGKGKHFAILRRFFKIYVANFPNASALRIQLMACNNLSEVEALVSPYLEEVKNLPGRDTTSTIK